MVLLLLPLTATAAAFEATRSTQQAWATALGGAAVLLGALCSVAGVLYMVG